MKKNLIILFLALLGLSWYTTVSAVVTGPKELEQHKKNAAEYEKKGIYVDAITEYNKILEIDESDVQSAEKLAKAYLVLDEESDFISTCKKYIQTDLTDPTMLDMLMNYYVEEEETADALSFLQNLLKQDTDNEHLNQWYLKIRGSYSNRYIPGDSIKEMYNGSYVVSRGDKLGVVSSTGEQIIDFLYDEIYPFSDDGYALALREDGQYVYLDEDGNVRKVPESGYKDLGMLSENRVVASKGNKFGYLDENMEEKTDFQWDQLTGIRDRTGVACKDGKWALVGATGKAKTEYIYEDVIIDEYGFCTGQERLFVKEKGKYHMVTKKGKDVGELEFDDARIFNQEGYAAVCMDGKWGFVDEEGELKIKCQYDDAYSFSHGFAAVRTGEKWNYVDTDGKLLLQKDSGLFNASPLSEEGTAVVSVLEDDHQVSQLIQFDLFR